MYIQREGGKDLGMASHRLQLRKVPHNPSIRHIDAFELDDRYFVVFRAFHVQDFSIKAIFIC